MKKRLITISITVAAGITLGYLFILSGLLGLLVSKYVAGKSPGEQGRVRSVIIPFRKWRIHLHHWLYSLCLIGFSFAIGLHFLSPTITYGLLGGSVFQGIYYYNDWHVIAIRKPQTREKRTATEASGS
ncbi:hypothetical protein ACFLVC_03145 [Chloroflexota bacterium]